VKINKNKKTQKERNRLISEAISKSKSISKVSLKQNSLNISKRSNEVKKNKHQIKSIDDFNNS
jgi:hypothetical protein